MNLIAWLALVAASALLKRRRECSAELCTCGCTAEEFDYAVQPKETEVPKVLRSYVPGRSAPTAVGPILAPYVPGDSGGGGGTGGGGGGTGGGTDPGTGGSGGSGTGGGGGGGAAWCVPEFCLPTWGGGQTWFERYGIPDPGCCKK